MAIQISDNDLISLSQAARLLPGKPHVSTLWRWRIRGSKGCHLETLTIAGRVFTSVSALQQFAEATNSAANSGTAITSRGLNRRREQEIAAAEARCQQAGA